MLPTILRFGEPWYTIYVYERKLITQFRDGTTVPAAPNTDCHSVALAAELGYLDTWDMSRDHEISHSWLARQAGFPYSPTLWHVAHPHDPAGIPPETMAREEATVLAYQKALDKTALRPWELKC